MSFSPFILLLAKSNPVIYEVVFPHGPKFSKGAIDVFGAQIVKSIAQSVNNQPTGKALDELARQLYTAGTTAMNYEEDNFCGTPYPVHPHIYYDPEPNPWFVGHPNRQEKQMTNKYYGGMISIVSQVVSDQKIAGQLNKIGNELMGQKE